MDKYELVIDVVEHPGNYTAEQVSEILSDPEAKEIYNLLCKVDSAIAAECKPDVDVEWADFSGRHPAGRNRLFFQRRSRAASVAVIICASIAAVAGGIAVSVAFSNRSSTERQLGLANDKQLPAVNAETEKKAEATATDSVTGNISPVVFEDESLESIMGKVAAIYGVIVRFNHRESATLHLYYKFDPALSLDEVVAQLNTFEQINIRRDSDTIIIN